MFYRIGQKLDTENVGENCWIVCLLVLQPVGRRIGMGSVLEL